MQEKSPGHSDRQGAMPIISAYFGTGPPVSRGHKRVSAFQRGKKFIWRTRSWACEIRCLIAVAIDLLLQTVLHQKLDHAAARGRGHCLPACHKGHRRKRHGLLSVLQVSRFGKNSWRSSSRFQVPFRGSPRLRGFSALATLEIRPIRANLLNSRFRDKTARSNPSM